MPRRSQPVLTLTAAAKRVDLRSPKEAKAQAAKRQDWFDDAWLYFDTIPLIKESIRYRGNQLGKVRLYVAVDNPDDPDGDPIPVSAPESGVPEPVATAAEAELSRLRSAIGGQAQIMRHLDMNLEVVGICYLVGKGERTEKVTQRDGSVQNVTEPEDWMIRSVSEVEVKGSGESTRYFIKSDPSDTKGTPLDPELDTIMRIWLQHPQWSNLPDCAMRALIEDCRLLAVLRQQLLAHSLRALNAGILTVPNQLAPKGQPDPSKPEDPVDDPLMDTLYEVLTEPIFDPSAPSSTQPGLLRGEPEHLKPDVLRLISFYQPEILEGIEKRIEARTETIAQGLNLPVEKVKGMMGTTFSNADQIDQDEYDDYLAPSADMATDALTYAFLHPQLLENPSVPSEYVSRLFIAADPSALFGKPDTEKNADTAWDRGTISDAAHRKAKGFSEDDAPKPEELLIRAALKSGRMSADVTLAVLKMMGVPLDVVPGEAGQDTNPPAVTASVLRRMIPAPIRAASRPSSPDYGRRLTEIDRELRSRLLTASNVAMGQALDRAATRLRSKTNGTPERDALRTVGARYQFVQLGRDRVTAAFGDDDPLEGAWDGLEDEFRAWGADAQSRARTTAGQAVGADLSGLEDQQAEDLDSAWLWFAAALTGLATARLWTPDPSAPTIGEYDPTVMIPAGMVRQAVARAGGAQGLITGGQDAWVTLTDAGTRPAGGIGTGDLIRGALRDGGATIEGYVWQYGPGFRRSVFEPHERLNGTPFVNFDDDVLASQGEFGWSHYLPGDHSGCLCDVEPSILGADERG